MWREIFSWNFLCFLIRLPKIFIGDIIKGIIEGIKERREKTMFFKKREKTRDWAELALYWKGLQEGSLSKRDLKRLPDKVAKLVCFSEDKAGLNNFLKIVKNSKYSEFISNQWKNKKKGKRCVWWLSRGAEICLQRLETIE